MHSVLQLVELARPANDREDRPGHQDLVTADFFEQTFDLKQHLSMVNVDPRWWSRTNRRAAGRTR
jgi:hypothetical protein